MTDQRPPILIVEDEVFIRMAAVDMVEHAGFEALEAPNADAAIGILERRPDIRLVFTDVDMPGTMDGLKLAHYIRHRWPPILLMVTSGKSVIEEKALPDGARFFSKPYAERIIANTMRKMLEVGDA